MHLAEYCKENFIFKSEKTPNLIFKYEIKITGKKNPWKKCVPENKTKKKTKNNNDVFCKHILLTRYIDNTKWLYLLTH